jgi:hypothetical protein
MRRLVLIGVLAAWACRPTLAQEEPAGEVPAERSQRMEMIKRAAAEYEIFRGPGRAQKLELHAEPVLRWSNPIRKTPDGAVFLWTRDGRPEVALCIYTYMADGIDHEFQSLSTAPLSAEYRGQPVWSPMQAGIEYSAVPGAPAVARSAALRLSQMREISRRFTSWIGQDDHKQEVRLLTQPIYRYESRRKEILDGAVFAFVQGTDPEVLLLLEAQPQGEGHAWRYALARMTMVAVESRYQDQVVWRLETLDQLPIASRPYVTFVKRIGQ